MTIIKRLSIALAGAAVAMVVGFGGVASAAPQWCIDMGGPPCKGGPGGGEEEAGNNLSLPANLTDTTNTIPANWSPPADSVRGEHYSFGCNKKEVSGAFSYPNTSCVDDLMKPTLYLDAEECTVPTDAPCYGESVSRIYWQKVVDNDWWADEDGIDGPASVAYVDWGDALEARSWTSRSQIRVETQPYSSRIPGFDPTLGTCENASADPEADCKVGFQMWHVSGQGTSEHWGVRAEELVSYNYDSPFQIIKTDNARLNIAKMEPDSAECPQPGGGEDGEGEVVVQQLGAPVLSTWTGSDWEGACTWRDAPYSVELSVGGKYVYGYNWPMKSVNTESVCGAGWLKTGWWRLTFYTPGDEVVFDDENAPVSAPPAVPAQVRELPRTAFNTAIALPDDGESEALYVPVVNSTYNLSYIDLCIVARDAVGAGGGGGGGGGGHVDSATQTDAASHTGGGGRGGGNH